MNTQVLTRAFTRLSLVTRTVTEQIAKFDSIMREFNAAARLHTPEATIGRRLLARHRHRRHH